MFQAAVAQKHRGSLEPSTSGIWRAAESHDSSSSWLHGQGRMAPGFHFWDWSLQSFSSSFYCIFHCVSWKNKILSIQLLGGSWNSSGITCSDVFGNGLSLSNVVTVGFAKMMAKVLQGVARCCKMLQVFSQQIKHIKAQRN